MSEKEKNSVPFTKAGLKGKSGDPSEKETENKNAVETGQLPKESKKDAENKSDDKPLH